MVKKIQEIRRELRDLRRLTHSIDTMLTLRDNHERRIKYLTEKATPEAQGEAERIKGLLDGLKIEESIAKANELEARYMSAIGKLEPLERTVIIEGYINGKPYWKIGKEMGYSERSIQARVNAALEKLARTL